VEGRRKRRRRNIGGTWAGGRRKFIDNQEVTESR
jgi:hypothetical protein